MQEKMNIVSMYNLKQNLYTTKGEFRVKVNKLVESYSLH